MLGFNRPIIFNVAVPPLMRLPIFQTPSWMFSWFILFNVKPGGMVTFVVKPVTSRGPWLLAFRVKVTFSPICGDGLSTVIFNWTSATRAVTVRSYSMGVWFPKNE